HGIGGFGEAEIENLDDTLGRDLDVGGFQVAVDDALFVGGFQGFGNLAGYAESFVERDGAGGDALVEGLAGNEFHHQGFFLDAVNDRDVWMVERSENLGFANEPREVVGIIGQGVGEEFDRDVAIQLGIGGAVHRAHAAFSELRCDLVVANGGGRAHRIRHGELYHLD